MSTTTASATWASYLATGECIGGQNLELDAVAANNGGNKEKPADILFKVWRECAAQHPGTVTRDKLADIYGKVVLLEDLVERRLGTGA